MQVRKGVGWGAVGVSEKEGGDRASLRWHACTRTKDGLHQGHVHCGKGAASLGGIHCTKVKDRGMRGVVAGEVHVKQGLWDELLGNHAVQHSGQEGSQGQGQQGKGKPQDAIKGRQEVLARQ